MIQNSSQKRTMFFEERLKIFAFIYFIYFIFRIEYLANDYFRQN